MILTLQNNDSKPTILLHLDNYLKSSKNDALNMSPDDHIAKKRWYIIQTYSKDKPAKYYLNFRSLHGYRSPYIYYTVPYTGLAVEVTESLIKDTLTLVKRFVEWY